MAKAKSLFSAPGVTFEGGVLRVKGGQVAIEEQADGSWVMERGANAYAASTAQVNAINAIQIEKSSVLDLNAAALVGETIALGGPGVLNITGIIFKEADTTANAKFEPGTNLDSFIGGLIGTGGENMDYALNHLTVNGGKADAFKLVWDYLDDLYGQAGYSNAVINEAFVRLGVEYAQYLNDGGTPLTDVIAKFAPDNGDAGLTPQRLQSMHDNLLGNFNASDFNSPTRFPADVRQELLDYLAEEGLSSLLTRPAYSGNEGTTNNALAWDVANGYLGSYDSGSGRGNSRGQDANAQFDRHDDQLHAKDYETDSVANLDQSSTRDGAGPGNDINVGTGNTAANYNVSTNHDLGLELGLKVHFRGGADILPESTDADGTAHYDAPSGNQATNRAKWNFDFSVNTGLGGSEQTLDAFDFRIVIESADGERGVFNLEHLGPGVTPWLNAAGLGFNDEDGLNPQISQNSVNLGFGFMQAVFGADYNDAGEHYDIYLQAFDGNKLVGEVHSALDIVV